MGRPAQVPSCACGVRHPHSHSLSAAAWLGRGAACLGCSWLSGPIMDGLFLPSLLITVCLTPLFRARSMPAPDTPVHLWASPRRGS